MKNKIWYSYHLSVDASHCLRSWSNCAKKRISLSGLKWNRSLISRHSMQHPRVSWEPNINFLVHSRWWRQQFLYIQKSTTKINKLWVLTTNQLPKISWWRSKVRVTNTNYLLEIGKVIMQVPILITNMLGAPPKASNIKTQIGGERRRWCDTWDEWKNRADKQMLEWICHSWIF